MAWRLPTIDSWRREVKMAVHGFEKLLKNISLSNSNLPGVEELVDLKNQVLSAHPQAQRMLMETAITQAQKNHYYEHAAQHIFRDLPAPSVTSSPQNNLHAKALMMLKMRLSGLDSKFELNKDDMLICHVTSGMVYCFFVLNGKAGVLQEEASLFPSDKLVTQFHLIPR
jgi:hypothetical protein